jgi:putative addiction module killer protein
MPSRPSALRGAPLSLEFRIQLATIHPFTVRLTHEFENWLDGLTDERARIRIAARLRHAEIGNLGDWASVGRGVFEMRVHHGPGYRLYFVRRGRRLIVLLAGGAKSTQARDIRRAQKIAQEIGDFE